MTDTQIKNKTERNKSIPDKSTEIAAASGFFLKYQFPWINQSCNSFQSENNSVPNIFKRDPLARFISGKRKFLNKSLDDILNLIKKREKIKDRNSLEIDHEICQIHTSMLNHPKNKYAIDMAKLKSFDALQQQVNALYNAKRVEEISCWRDVTRLKSDLRESINELEQEKRKQSLLLGDNNDRHL
jgi:hypothetical protein